ncbi:CDC27 family protein [Flavobacterium sp. TR2]|uniref:CDC27 family protein n=1 Tax=Flavobacterium sp. TR2 TaxID=2977321 RepID=UPI0021B0B6DB|nr:CDC27 family protein [Flavobacterium sp. TR2]UWY29708.1 CDC27 family protein [Flavobacterium sp. TR2]
MRNFIWSLSLLFAGISISSAQTNGIEKGTYLSTNKGGKIKLNLLDDNKYELVFYSGGYEIKGDSLVFLKSKNTVNRFDLSFVKDKKAKKIKIKFLNPSYYSFYIGTQKGTETVQYQKVSDIKTKEDPEWVKTDLEFEIDKTDFLYLVYEDYNGKSDVNKYALPKDVSEVTINYDLAVLSDLNLVGFFDKNTKELKVSDEHGKDPLVFVNEKDEKPAKIPTVVPVETQSITNWTYPGKEPDYGDAYGAAVDSVIVDTAAVAGTAYPIDPPTAYTKYDFKLKIEDNLKKAIESTKTAASNKFLVVVVDSKNKAAKENFDAFVKEQETQTGYNMYDSYNALYDTYNFYLAGADDKKWLKNNKITNDPSLLVLNGNGDLLAIAKSDLTTQQYQFSYYGDLNRKLQKANAFLAIDKVLKNKKASDADLIAAFNKVASLEPSYDYDSEYTVSDPNSTDFVLTKTVLDQKAVAQTWKKLIEAHQKDKAVNMYLAETIIKEIKNQGFTKQLFNQEKILNDTDFLAIDYLLKHSDDIENNKAAFNSSAPEIHNVGNAVSEVSNALQQNLYASQDGLTGEMNKEKINSVYKEIIASGKGNFDAYRNYFYYLSQLEDQDGSNATYLKEFSTYFDNTLAGASPIEKLDAIFGGLDSSSSYSYDGWSSFKLYHSDICNNAAWTVVLKPQNSNFLKEAIKWSEYSLVISKNNPYYLDTLAQLYYKNGQAQKAIETQVLAVKFITSDVDEETANQMKEVLTKMSNGTY